MGRKRRACARARRVAALGALAAAALFARERLGTHGAVSPGSSEVGARRSTSASAGLASRVPTPAVADASDADEAVVSSPAADEVATRAGARVARLSAADAARRYGFARNASITATFATIEVADMLRNWIEHAVFVARLPNVAVIALDEATLSKCANGAFFQRRADETNDARLQKGLLARSLTCLDASRAFEDADALRVDAASRALHDRLPRKVGRVVAVFPTAAQAAKRRKRIGGKVECLHDDAGTFAAACGVSMESAGVVVLAPPHPSPDQHTIVARFPAALDGVASAVESALRDKGVLPAVRRTG